MALTVTATQTGDTFQGIMLSLRVLTGAAAAAAQSGGTASAPGSNQVTVTTTATGSVVLGAIADPNNETWSSPLTSTTQIAQVADATNGCTYLAFRSTLPTVVPGAAAFGYSDANTGAVTAAEILPSGTILTDASTPAVVSTDTDITVTTASFTPPAGSLLAAVVASDSNDSSPGIGITVSDSSGLTWHQLVFGQGTSFMASGVWVADAPAGGGVSVAGQVAQLVLAAPAGSVSAGGSVAGLVAALALAAPAGSVQAGAAVSGQVASLALAAPAGSISAGATVAGQVAQLVLAAPAGAVQVSGPVSVSGQVAQLVLAAPAGSVSAGGSVGGPPVLVFPDSDRPGLLRKPVLW
jgi:hypothetical protein